MLTRSPQSEGILDVILLMVNDDDFVFYILGSLSWYCLSSRSTFYWSTNSSRIFVFMTNLHVLQDSVPDGSLKRSNFVQCDSYGGSDMVP